MNASMAEGYKAHIALAETKIAEIEPEVAKTAERAEAAKERLAKIKRGEDVEGGLFSKPIDVVAICKKAGWTPSDFRRAELLASLTKTEFERVLANAHPAEAVDKAVDREVRRIIRARE